MESTVATPRIISQDTDLLIIDKPPFWIVNDAQTAKTQTLQTYIFENFDFETAKDQQFRSGIVHRLDKETSGVMVVAKTKDAFANLQGQFKDRKTQKTYLALVHGKVEQKNGEIDAPVGRLPWRRDRFGVFPGGRQAKTLYSVIDYYTGDNDHYTYLKLFPHTGRTHQIRVHMKYLGNPVVADTFYAGRKTARRDRKWCQRLFLHAHKLSFFHPRSNKAVSYSAELPEDLSTAFHTLKKVG